MRRPSRWNQKFTNSKQEKADDEISTLTDRIISLEGHMKRDNLKLLNVRQQNMGGQNENYENLVISLFNDLNIDLDERSIARAHRSGPRGKVNQPIIIKFHHFKDKLKVLKAKKRLREIGIIVVEDFPSVGVMRRSVAQWFSPDGGRYSYGGF